MGRGAHGNSGFTLIELMIVIAIIAIIAAIAIPGLLNSLRAANGRNASGSLKTIATAQADFRSADRDLNRVSDYWTGDIAGLFAVDNSSTGGAIVANIKLIEINVALADINPFTGSLSNGNYDTPIATFGVQSSKATYWYMTLDEDLQAAAISGNGDYQLSTDTTGDLVHNVSRFGVAAMPSSYGSGYRVYIINEHNTMFSRDFGQDVLTSVGIPPALNLVFDGNYPLNADLAANWGKLD